MAIQQISTFVVRENKGELHPQLSFVYFQQGKSVKVVQLNFFPVFDKSP